MFKVPARKEIKPLVIEKFLGIDLSGDPTQIDIRRSPDMLNLQLDSQGCLERRMGYELVRDSGSSSKIEHLSYDYKKREFHFAVYNQLWATPDWRTFSMIGLMFGDVIQSFVMNDKKYFLDGIDYKVYNGLTLMNVEGDAYTPTLILGRAPSGGGTLYEQINLLSPWVIDSFSADGTATQYTLSLNGLDANLIIATTDGVNYNKVEGTDFNVNRSTGIVSWVTAPPQGINNVKIKYKKTQAGFADRIKKCTIFALYGGANDSRVFVSGNPDYPNMDWRSDIYRPDYFGENSFSKIGSDTEKIMGYSKQYDTLVIHKERSKWSRSYDVNNTLIPFPIKSINDKVGLSAKFSLQIIDNNPVGLTKQGVYALKASQIKDERNVEHISQRVDRRLLNEVNLDKALSFDFEKKYAICVNGNVYVWDYAINEWYIWDNINATCFLEHEGVLYFGTNDGKIFKFKKRTDEHPYNDNGQAINSYWYSKLLFGEYFYKKLIEKVFFTLKPETRRSATTLSYKTDKKTVDDIMTSRIDILSFFDFDFTRFSFLTNSLPQTKAKKIKAKKVMHFQMKLENNRADESMSVTNVGIKFNLQGEVK